MNYWRGQKNEYYWFETDVNDFDFSGLLKYFSEFLLNKYVLINCFDSGSITWSGEERRKGLECVNGISITNRISDVGELPYDNYDEWYIFNEKRDVAPLNSFVNYLVFHLRDEIDQDQLREIQLEFWTQLMKTEADRFRSQDGRFIYVSKVKAEVDKLEEYCSSR